MNSKDRNGWDSKLAPKRHSKIYIYNYSGLLSLHNLLDIFTLGNNFSNNFSTAKSSNTPVAIFVVRQDPSSMFSRRSDVPFYYFLF